eukprot:CAMPEP_0168340216 /NCGR_PEP_ID=MMETSP0213-20121227/13931_1 /TAXON_ID=151035 /ORGANISM="Euplotes harpa, Strain FSP1.4" /LENGTH=182 /DNA_ID=CAMNT_0008346409 /DNA_START=122 /DNA_END=667 /DNA_ORIENTATION=+
MTHCEAVFLVKLKGGLVVLLHVQKDVGDVLVLASLLDSFFQQLRRDVIPPIALEHRDGHDVHAALFFLAALYSLAVVLSSDGSDQDILEVAEFGISLERGQPVVEVILVRHRQRLVQKRPQLPDVVFGQLAEIDFEVFFLPWDLVSRDNLSVELSRLLCGNLDDSVLRLVLFLRLDLADILG